MLTLAGDDARKNETLFRFLDDLGQATAASADADEILAITTRAIAQHLSLSNCAYADMDEDQDGFTIRGNWHAPGSPSIVGHYQLAEFGTLAVRELGAGRPLVINDNLNELAPEEAKTFQDIGIAATICMPLVKAGRLVALMAIHDRVPHQWSDYELAVIHEVTQRSWAHVERVRSEAEVRSSNERFRAAIRATRGVLWTNDALGRMIGEQTGWAALTGQSFEEYQGFGWATALHPDDVEPTLKAWNEAVAERRTFDFEHRVKRYDGQWGLFSVRAVPLMSDAGDVIEWVGVHTDITAKRVAQDALRESDARFRNMADHAPMMMWVTDASGRCTYLNQRWYDFTGQTEAEAEGSGWLDATHPDDKAEAERIFLEANAEHMPFELEYRLRRADGVYRWVIDAASPRFAATGTFLGYIGSVVDIDERKRAEEVLRESEERYRSLFGAIDAGFCIVEMKFDENNVAIDYKIVEANPAFEKQTGLKDALGKWVSETAPDLERHWHEAYGRVALTGEAVRFENQAAPFADRWYDVHAYRVGDPSEHRVAILFDDISDRKQSELELASRNRRLALLARIAEGLLLDTSLDERLKTAFADIAREVNADYYFNFLIDEVDPALMRLASSGGLTKKQRAAFKQITVGDYLCGRVAATGQPLIIDDLDQSDDPACAGVIALDGKCYAGFPLIAEARLLGTISFASTSHSRFTDDQVALMRTVSDQVAIALARGRAANALADNEAELRAIFEQLSEGVIIADTAGRLTLVNRCAEELHGVKSLLVSPEDYSDTYHLLTEDGRPYPATELPLAKAVLNGEVVEDARWRIRRPDGSDVLAIGSARPIRDNDGEQIGAVLTLRDDTPRHAAEQAIRESEARLREKAAEFEALAENVSQLAWMADPDGSIFWYNKRWYDYTGTTAVDQKGWGWESVHDPEILPAVTQRWRESLATGTLFEMTFPIKGADGIFRPFLTRVAPIRDESGAIVRWFGTNTDITELRQAQDALRALNETLEQRVEKRTAELILAQDSLRQSQKLEAMGQLTGGVAHDFNNLLTPIVGTLDMLQRRQVGDERERRLIDGAVQSAERARMLVQRLLAFARRQPLTPSAIDLATLIEGMADLVSSTSGPQIKVVVGTTEDLKAAYADANQLEMAILNLAVNARDAMPEGGTLTLAVENDAVGPSHRSGLPPGDYVRLSVADTGTGMSQSTLARAIEPFFSTKGIGKGTGLGLSMVHGLALQLGGAMALSSEPGLGTKVDLWLPVSKVAAEPPAPDPDQESSPGVGAVVLLVDDEPAVRASTADMLQELGYAVVEADSAAAALTLLEGGLVPDLLLTDHLMPGMTGADLAREVRGRWPDRPILLITGFAEVDDVAPDLPRLTKPFRQAELSAMLIELTA